jgi:hypothetical protein
MRPVGVVEQLELAQGAQQVPLVPDQGPIEQLAAAGLHPSLHIANKFAIRHRNKDEQGNYDPAFLNWIFWWYLGTVELTDRIIRRQENKSA